MKSFSHSAWSADLSKEEKSIVELIMCRGRNPHQPAIEKNKIIDLGLCFQPRGGAGGGSKMSSRMGVSGKYPLKKQRISIKKKGRKKIEKEEKNFEWGKKGTTTTPLRQILSGLYERFLLLERKGVARFWGERKAVMRVAGAREGTADMT